MMNPIPLKAYSNQQVTLLKFGIQFFRLPHELSAFELSFLKKQFSLSSKQNSKQTAGRCTAIMWIQLKFILFWPVFRPSEVWVSLSLKATISGAFSFVFKGLPETAFDLDACWQWAKQWAWHPLDCDHSCMRLIGHNGHTMERISHYAEVLFTLGHQ